MRGVKRSEVRNLADAELTRMIETAMESTSRDGRKMTCFSGGKNTQSCL